ncbi:phenylalanine--tRNA ligase subunit beta [Candidatus Pacearchaeota archaeon CG10_big_fil_rev_8_21_14_0_10_34_76]|nr:MAG: phenylalanine--tRNA ligase subunit beta [Candidatus Pacearchaeota archaeon CG10_big_fil_rev_8_21_14_0_10_34_76]
MTNVTFPRKEFEKHIKLTKEVIDKISLFGTPLEKIDDKSIEIEVFPNRPDLIPLHGFIRGFKAFLGKEVGLKKYALEKPEKDNIVYVEKNVKDIRPYIACAIVKDINFDDEKIKEIIDLQEKLHITIGRDRKKAAIGIYPLEKIKLPIKYEARNPIDIRFKPLGHDKELNANQILNRHPTGKKYASLLKGYKKFPVFVDAEKNILSMPPILNSDETGKITEKTKSVFVECSGFDQNVLNKIINIIVTALSDMGGKIYQMHIQDKKNFISPDFEPEMMPVSIENTNRLLGLSLSEKDVRILLNKMGHDYKEGYAIIPPWRTDILHEVDLIEDIAIAYGYDKIEPEIPNLSTIGNELRESKIKNKISELLIGLGLIEISTYHLIKPEEAKKMKIQNPIEVQDSKTEYKILRPNLFIPGLRIISENIDAEYPQKIFEIGRVFTPDEKTETGIRENDSVLIALTPSNFTEAKQHLDYLLNSLGLDYTIKESETFGLIPGRTGKISISGKEIGYIGEVHPNTLKSWHLKMPLSTIELSLSEIYKQISKG